MVAALATLAFAVQPPAASAAPAAPRPRALTLQIAMLDDFFDPEVTEGVVSIMGVNWSNQGQVFHNVVLVPGPAWYSTNLDEGQSDGTQLEYAGTFDYVCIYHPAMVGSLRISPLVQQGSGRVGDTFPIQLSSVDLATTAYVFDVQRRRNDGRWGPARRASDSIYGFTPRRAGAYDLRVRLVEPGADVVGEWSPRVRVRVRA